MLFNPLLSRAASVVSMHADSRRVPKRWIHTGNACPILSPVNHSSRMSIKVRS